MPFKVKWFCQKCRPCHLTLSINRELHKRAFTNYVDQMLPILDHLPTTGWHLWRNSFTVISTNLHTVDISRTTYLPTSSYQRSLWTLPNWLRELSINDINQFFHEYYLAATYYIPIHQKDKIYIEIIRFNWNVSNMIWHKFEGIFCFWQNAIYGFAQ